MDRRSASLKELAATSCNPGPLRPNQRDAWCSSDTLQSVSASVVHLIEETPRSGLRQHFLEQRSALLRFFRARGAGERSEDLLHDLWLNAGTPGGPVANPVAYLFRAANNLLINDVRTHSRRVLRDAAWAEDQQALEGDGAFDRLAARDEIEMARTRLEAAGQRVLQAYVLCRVEGMAQSEAAEAMGISLSTIEKDLQKAYRAIAGLKDELDD